MTVEIMNVVIESSGAQHGHLLIGEEGHLFVRAESHAAAADEGGDGDDKPPASRPVNTAHRKLDEVRDVCRAVIRYVYRTGERVLLDNAAQEGAFKDSAEVHALQMRSVLCLPVVKQSRNIGTLYLENRLSDAVFTPEKSRMTELLTSWAALALENARLLDALKKAEETNRQLEKETLVLQARGPGPVPSA